MLILTLFGKPHGSLSGASDTTGTLLAGKPLALLAYLCCAPSRSASRGRLVDLLWADVDPDSGKHALRQTLWYIRRRLGDSVVAAEGDALRITPDLSCDRNSFLAAIERGDLESATAAYTGEFFPGFAAPGGAEFERWADVERAHLRGLFVRAAEDLARRSLGSGVARGAIALARRARDADPDNEATWRLLLEALLAASDRIGASSEADALERRLADEDREAEPATLAAIRAVRHADASPTPRTESRPTLIAELVGRETEFSTIVIAWERARTGNAEHVHLTAPAGLGKTRLLSDVEARLRASRARVVRLRAAPGERGMPYALAAELALSLARLRGAAGVSSGAASTLVTLNPAVSAWLTATPDLATGDDVPRRRALALHELLQAASAETPIALLIDDLHWADEASRHVLLGLAARLQNDSALLLTASRPPSPFPADGSSMRLLPLIPLDALQITTLMSSIAVLPREDWGERIPFELHGATGGSPLLVLEMLQFALDHGRLRIDSGSWCCDDTSALVADLRPGRAVERRVAELDAAARQVLVVLALAGVPISSAVVADAVDRTQHECDATLARLEQIGLVARDGNAWLPQHDEIASAAVAAADEETRRDSHRGLVTAFARGPSAEPSAIRRALSHAIASGDDTLQSRMARDYVALARRRGETRRASALVEEALGADASPALVRGLAATFPLSERVAWRRVSRTVAAAGAVLVLVTALWRTIVPPPRVSANTLLVSVLTGSDSAVYAVDVDGAEGEPDAVLDVAAGTRASPTLSRAFMLYNAAERPDRQSWLGWREFRAPAVNLDLVLAAPDGSERRLASNPEDETQPSWSPDGQFAVFLTRRWDAGNGTDVARVTIATDEVVKLTNTVHDELSPRFSPDGSRIAYLRAQDDPTHIAVCLARFDGSAETCRTIAGVALHSRLWFPRMESLILSIEGANAAATRLVRYELATGALTTIDSSAMWYDVSPDGLLAVAARHNDASGAARLYVMALQGTLRGRPLQIANGILGGTAWRASRRVLESVDRIRIRSQRDTIPLEMPSQLRYRAESATHRELPDVGVQWRSLDSTVASVDDSGRVMPRREGRARIVASAGGYRADTTTLVVSASTSTAWLDERWTNGVAKRWRYYGDPLPKIIRTESGDSAIFLNGDRSNTSGAHTRESLDVSRGGGVEVLTSIPISTLKWQSFSLFLQPVSSTGSPRDNADGGELPVDWTGGLESPICGVGMPAEEGPRGVNSLSVRAGSVGSVLQRAPELTSGSWHALRLQIFPDGRCGVAIDGRAVWLSSSSIVLDRPLSVMLSGRSAGTTILVGRTRVWRGIDPGVNWGPSPFRQTASTTKNGRE